MEQHQWIIEAMPYGKDFLFVDSINQLTPHTIEGEYYFHDQHAFYTDHFPENPITPGVILMECMAQIGLLALGITKLANSAETLPHFQFAFSSAHTEFLAPVYPNTKVIVRSEEVYFRFNKLKVNAEMRNVDGQLLSKAELAGMILKEKGNKS